MLCPRLNSPDICPAVKVISHGLLKHLFIIYLMELLDLRPSGNIFVHCGRHCTASAGALPDYGSGLACHNIWLTKTLGEGGIVLSHTVNQCSTHVCTRAGLCQPTQNPYMWCILILSVGLSRSAAGWSRQPLHVFDSEFERLFMLASTLS